jgi:hypothetical protein
MKMRGTSVLLLVSILATAPQGAEAQRQTYTKGQPVYPAYEGWVKNADGSIEMLFGYMNQNWEQVLDIPIGPDNRFSPGPADAGQPTHFLPRRNRFVFQVRVPEGFEEDDELVWSIRANGQEFRAYGTLREDLYVDNIIIMSETGALGAGTSDPEIRANIPPQIELEGGMERSVGVGETLSLAAVITDDGEPNRERRRLAREAASAAAAAAVAAEADADAPDAEEEAEADEEEDAEPTPRELLQQALQRRTASSTVSKRVALHFTWFLYRGPDQDSGQGVEFDPPQIKPWEDTRPFANSPWALAWTAPELPEDGRWVSEVTFSEPGTYVLRGRADDGGLYSDVEVTVRVQATVF